MKKSKKNAQKLDAIRSARGIERKERLEQGTWMPRGSVHDKPSRSSKRLDEKFKSAMTD